MGDWKSGGGNIIKSSNLFSIKPPSRNFEETSDRYANQVIKNPHTKFLNRNELEFSDLSDSQPVHLKSQMTRAVQFRSSNTITRFTDTLLLGKVKGSSVLRSLTMWSDGGFASFVGKMFLFSCLPESMVPDLYGTQTITSANTFAYSDDDSNDRTLFTLTGDFVDLMIYNGSVLSFSGTPVADLNNSTNYTVTNVARADANTVSFNLTVGAGGSNVDFHDGEDPVTGQAATISLVTTKAVATLASFGSHSMNHGFNPDLVETWTPSATNNPELLQWNHVGRNVAEISYEQYHNTVNRVNNKIASPRFAPRPIHPNDWAYIGIQFLENPTYDGGSTQARLSAFIDYMDL
tara:strand:- start:12060 stop:13103 length:1044 start_codon:yes stop_codon:yes gene_type:complete